MNSPSHDQGPDKKPTILQLIGSVLSAAIGIRSSKHSALKNGKASTYAIAGAIYVALFILTIYSLVQLVLRFSVH